MHTLLRLRDNPNLTITEATKKAIEQEGDAVAHAERRARRLLSPQIALTSARRHPDAVGRGAGAASTCCSE